MTIPLRPARSGPNTLTLADAQGVVLFSNDILLETADTFASLTSGTGSLGAPLAATWTKFAP
jgi:hypothetical protein